MLDGMKLKEHLHYNKFNDSLVGLIGDSSSSGQPNEALVFMVVGLCGNWKQSIGYFLIRGISASKQASLIKEAIVLLHEINVRVVSLTMDGCSTNISSIRELGCSIKPPMVLSFNHPVNSTYQIFIFLDVCHMIKLLRNLWANEKVFKTRSGIALWSFMERLINYQEEEECSAGNKITQKHVNWENQPMKVIEHFLTF
jgi:hypothetical protein